MRAEDFRATGGARELADKVPQQVTARAGGRNDKQGAIRGVGRAPALHPHMHLMPPLLAAEPDFGLHHGAPQRLADSGRDRLSYPHETATARFSRGGGEFL